MDGTLNFNRNYKLYEVGGCIRDELLGIPSKDIDYSFVWDSPKEFRSALGAFIHMQDVLKKQGFKIFKSFPEAFTVRAKFPKNHQYSGDADFVMARREVSYHPGTRTPIVEPGTLTDDLNRRDFTVNALAKDQAGNIIDICHGQEDLEDRLLRTPLDPKITFNDDPLRILRGFRFCVTKGFRFGNKEVDAIAAFDVEKMRVVSVERKMEELTKMFKFSTERTLNKLCSLKLINKSLWLDLVDNKQGMWLMPTNKKK